jgi:Raf kinase inhibitor-like YbhB/YbcL family protein
MSARMNLPWVAFLFAGLLCSSCSNEVQPSEKGNIAKIQMTSPAFQDGQVISEKYTGHGDDVSPPLDWNGAPPQAKGFAVICEDPDAPSGTFTHWVIYNIPATSKGLSENIPKGESLPDGSAQGKNSFGNIGYNGPAPPAGKVHHYIFSVYALDIILQLSPGADSDDALKAMNGHVLAQGKLTGTFETGM